MISAGELAATFGGSARTSFGDEVCAVPLPAWRDAVEVLLREGLSYLDWLSVVDNGGGSMTALVHLVAPRRGAAEPLRHLLLTTELDQSATIASITPVIASADWHEREAAEMFGVTFAGHPRPGPLLLLPGFDGHPLRKDFALGSRVATPWPGTHEPGADLARTPRSRRRTTPPGLPEEWLDSADDESDRP